MMSIFINVYDDVVWDEPENRRKFFENYAQANGFDPLIAKNWYSQLLDVLSEVCLSFSPIFHILFEGGRGGGWRERIR